MYRCTILYGQPDDPAEFDRYYREVHIPIARKMAGLTGWNLTWVDSMNGELPAEVYLIADLYAADKSEMDAVLASPEGQAAAADVPNFATGGATFLFGDEEEVLES